VYSRFTEELLSCSRARLLDSWWVAGSLRVLAVCWLLVGPLVLMLGKSVCAAAGHCSTEGGGRETDRGRGAEAEVLLPLWAFPQRRGVRVNDCILLYVIFS